MAKSTAPKLKTTTDSKKKAAVQATSYTAARVQVTDGIKKHGKAKKTTSNYAGHVQRGIKFLKQFSLEESEAEDRWKGGDNAEANLTVEGEDQMPIGDQAKMHPQFREALDGPPIECTPLAIAMFMAHKCMTENLGKSTASAIHAAFLRRYNQMQGDKFRGRWKYDNVSKEWTGNPVRSAEVEDMCEACKKKDGEGERRHSRAMSINDMQKIFEHSKLHCPSINPSLSFEDQRKEMSERCSYLFFNAFSSSAFTAWMRIGEVSTLQYKNLEFPQGRRKDSKSGTEAGNHHYFKLNLRNRKNWQKREKNGEHQLNGHTYQIYPQPKTPEIDMYTHVLEWLDFYERVLLGCALTDEDYIFPTIGANGLSVQPSCPISPDIAQKKIVHMAEQAGIEGAKYFTTHCFQRGGAQYRFMFAPIRERWTLARVRWWGGWAIGEHRDTLIRYLLDELYTYEEDHSNALCPNAPPKELGSASEFEILEGFRQDVNTHVAEMKTEIQECRTLFNQAFASLNIHAALPAAHATFPNPFPTNATAPMSISYSHPTVGSGTFPQQPAPAFPAPYSVQNFNVMANHQLTPCLTWNQSRGGSEPLSQVSASSSPSQSPPPHDFDAIERVHLIPKLTQSRSAKAYEQAVRDWEFADSSRSLYVPMKDWRPEWHKAGKLTQLYGQRQMVALEFINRFQRDKCRFEEAYPEHKKGFAPLMNAIRRAQQERGDREVRLTRRKHEV